MSERALIESVWVPKNEEGAAPHRRMVFRPGATSREVAMDVALQCRTAIVPYRNEYAAYEGDGTLVVKLFTRPGVGPEGLLTRIENAPPAPGGPLLTRAELDQVDPKLRPMVEACWAKGEEVPREVLHVDPNPPEPEDEEWLRSLKDRR